MAAIDFVNSHPRQSGVTTALINAAKEIDGAIVAINKPHADTIAAMDKDVSIRVVTQNVRGTHQKFIFDHFTVESLILEYERKIRDLERKLEEKNGVLQDLWHTIKGAIGPY